MVIKSEQDMLSFAANFAQNFTLPASLKNHSAQGINSTTSTNSNPEDHLAQDPNSNAIIIELIGDVGAGKTTFTRGLASGLGITEPITSPSFTIMKSYPLPTQGYLVHYDFYRLPDPGIMADDLAEHLTDPHNIVVIEWGNSISNLLPPNHYRIRINYLPDGTRSVKCESPSL